MMRVRFPSPAPIRQTGGAGGTGRVSPGGRFRPFSLPRNRQGSRLLSDRTRIGLLVFALLLLAVGVVGAFVHEPGAGNQAVSTTTTASTEAASTGSTGSTGSTAAPATASTAALSTAAPSSAAPSTSAPSASTTEVPRSGNGSGLGSSGTGQVAAGQGPTPQTGAPGWVFPAGVFALILAAATRRLAKAAG
jgi:cytoskeletal protein RodZ